MNKAKITFIKYQMQFTGQDGQDVKFDYVDIEFAPNLFVRFKLTPNNVRVLMRYNPDLYQLFCNIPYGLEIPFAEVELKKPETTITDIYKDQTNEL